MASWVTHEMGAGEWVSCPTPHKGRDESVPPMPSADAGIKPVSCMLSTAVVREGVVCVDTHVLPGGVKPTLQLSSVQITSSNSKKLHEPSAHI